MSEEEQEADEEEEEEEEGLSCVVLGGYGDDTC